MREIKFRAWDVRAKRYEFFDGFDRWGMILSSKSATIDSVSSDHLLLTDNPTYYIWEQFTGLHDKNGKEIYEEDILYWDGSVIGAVSFEHCEFIVGTGKDVRALCIAHEDVKIIGNIHENGDLLK